MLSTNFVKSPAVLTVWVFLFLLLLSIITAGVSVYLIFDGIDKRTEALESMEKYERLKKKKNEIEVPDEKMMPTNEDIVTLSNKVKIVNNLSISKGRPVLYLLTRLEELLPKEAYLISFNHKKMKGEIQIIAQSSDKKILTEFLGRLEEDPYFSEVLLTKKIFKDKEKAVHFEVRLKENNK